VANPHDDPILARRALIARLAELGQRVGYLFIAVAVVAFLVGFATGFPAATIGLTIAGLAGATVLLVPAIIAGYAVRAAEREDRA
jgi:ABC-type transport system involved in cytochrome bd biosynthesis fused ATPase/permease subunit